MQTSTADTVKACRGCGDSQPLSSFHKHKQMADGHLNYCKACTKEYQMERYARIGDTIRAKVRAYHHKNRDRLNQQMRDRWKARSAEYKATQRVVARVRRNANPEADIARQARYAATHPDRIRHYNKTWRAKSHDVPVGLTLGEWTAMLGAVNGCAYCGSHDRIGIDHMVPLSRGGEHTQGNVVPCCLRCNASKFNLTTIEWFASTRKRALAALDFLGRAAAMAVT